MLKMNQKESDEDKVSTLQFLIDDIRKQNRELRLENRKANQKILDIESESRVRVEENMNEYLLKIKNLQNQLQCEKSSRSMEFEEKIATISEKDQLINLLQVSLHQKDLDIQELEEKYKRCIDKAKFVVKSMDTKHFTQTEVDTMNTKLINANQQLVDLTREQIDYKTSQENEEKLISTAFYKLAQTKMQESVDQRIMNNGLLRQTFLSTHR